MKDNLMTRTEARARLRSYEQRQADLAPDTPLATVQQLFDEVDQTLNQVRFEDPSEGPLYHLRIQLRDLLKTYSPAYKLGKLRERRDAILAKVAQARAELEEFETDVTDEWNEAESGSEWERGLDELKEQALDARTYLESAETELERTLTASE